MMAAALTLILTCSLLQSALCGLRSFKVIVPQSLQALRGSCVTIPCTFDIESKYDASLDHTCKAVWKMFSHNNVVLDHSKQTIINGELRGDLTARDCTTTLNNMHTNSTYYFRLVCTNTLVYSFAKLKETVEILVKDALPTPTLTLSSLVVREGTPVSLKCTAPAPCLTLPPTLTWTPHLGESHEALQENQNKTKVQTSVVNFSASHLHHEKTISCTATYKKQDGSTESSVGLTADISYSPKRTTVSVSPSGPVPENSIVNLTCSSNANPTVRNYTWYRADGGQETVIGTGHILTIKASEDSGPFFCKAENDLGAGRSNVSQLDVQFPPRILPSSGCTKTAARLNCSCETVGNPSPTFQWHFNGLPVHRSDKFAISNEPLNDTGLRSIITVNQPQSGDLSTLLCRSSNSLGSASQRFCVESDTSDQVTWPVFITTVVALLVLVCALLYVIRAQKIHLSLPKSQCTADTSTVAVNQLLRIREENEVPNTTEEDIYVNTNELRQEDVAHPATISEPNSTNLPSSGPNDAEGASKTSEKKTEEGKDVIYSSVNWKRKSNMKKAGASVDTYQPGSSYLEEERCMVGDMGRHFLSNTLEMGILYDEEPKHVKEEVECEYAQVKFKDKGAMHN